MKRKIYTGVALTVLLVGLGVVSYKLDKQSVVQAATTQAPKFEVDPMWPKPLPNHWIMGNVIGTSVDSNDHIWIIHRGGAVVDGVYSGSLEAKEVYAVQGWNGQKDSAPGSECCVPAPPVLEFDEAGNLIGHWGGPEAAKAGGYVWPDSNHGITVDYKGNVWIGGNGRGRRPGYPPPAARAVAGSRAGG